MRLAIPMKNKVLIAIGLAIVPLLLLPVAMHVHAGSAIHGPDMVALWDATIGAIFDTILEVSRLLRGLAGDLIQRITDEAEGWTIARV